MPTRGQRSTLSLAISYYAAHDQIGIVERRSVRMCQRVAEFPALVNGTRCFRRNVTGDAARKRTLLEEPLHSVRGLRNVRIDFAISSFQVSIRYQARATVPWSRNVNNIELIALDHAIEMNINEVQARRSAPES